MTCTRWRSFRICGLSGVLLGKRTKPTRPYWHYEHTFVVIFSLTGLGLQVVVSFTQVLSSIVTLLRNLVQYNTVHCRAAVYTQVLL